MSRRRAHFVGRRSIVLAVLLALVAPAAALVGCSVLVSLDGTTGGSSEGGVILLPPVETGTSPLPRDAGQGGRPPGDAGEGGAADAFDAGSGFCATDAAGASFCDDFDEETSLSRWTQANLFFANVGTFSTSAFTSSPQAFELNMPMYNAQNGQTFDEEALLKTVDAGATSTGMSFSFDLLPAVSADGGVEDDTYIASIAQGEMMAPRSAISARIGADGLFLQEQENTLTTQTFNDVAPATWTPNPATWVHFELTIDFASLTATIVQDQVTVVTLPLTGTNWSAAAKANFWLGNWYVTHTTGYDVFYDNAVIRRF